LKEFRRLTNRTVCVCRFEDFLREEVISRLSHAERGIIDTI